MTEQEIKEKQKELSEEIKRLEIQLLSEIIKNCNKKIKKLKGRSDYKGVTWNKQANKWKALITINGKQKYLGTYETQLDASEAYEKKLKELKNG